MDQEVDKKAILSIEAEEMYEKIINHIKTVIEECELHGISSIIYIKDPSLEERLKMIENIVPLMQAIENLTNNLHVGLKMAESVSCFTFLKLLLQSVRMIDEESFNHAKSMLEKLAIGVPTKL